MIFVTSRTDYQIQLPSMIDIMGLVTAGLYNGTNNTIVTLALFCVFMLYVNSLIEIKGTVTFNLEKMLMLASY